ncbi:hypothetical protein WJX73_000497 [Symbiochloris irregularis]|uniref:U-box domain-containing protein n=1 Tax=Symbiochloris irregularis TaxID=706552 RepID=A0AAW1NRB4_9CHLO
MGAGLSNLHDAAAKDHVGAVRILLDDEHVDPNLEDKDGWRALHFAAYGGSEKVTALLLDHNADVRATDQGGRTPLHLAALQGRIGVMKQLLDARAPANASDEHGMTPLHKAAVGGRTEAAQLLLNAGASYNARLKDGSTPVHLATWKGHVDTVKLLVSYGASPTAARDDGQTPLHEAAETGNARLAHAFLALGADKSVRNKEGFTAAEVAANAHHADVANLITQFDPRSSGTASASNRDSAFDYTPSPQTRGNSMVHPQLQDAVRQQQQAYRSGGRPTQVQPAASAYYNSSPSAPPAPSNMPSTIPGTPAPDPSPPGKVAYPKVFESSQQHGSNTAPQYYQSHGQAGTTRPQREDLWSANNIGRDASAFEDAQKVPLPGDASGQAAEPGKGMRPRDQFERAVQEKVGGFFGAITGAMQGKQPQKRAQTPQPQDGDWSGQAADDWGASGVNKGAQGTTSNQVPRTEKYDLEPYDDDDYQEDMSPKKSQVDAGPVHNVHEVQRRLAELELSHDRNQGWVRGGTKEDVKVNNRQRELLTQQEREIAHLQAQLDKMQAANRGMDGKPARTAGGSHARSTDGGIPTEYICPITQEVFEDPVIAADGYTYERAPMLAWLQGGHRVSPMTNEDLAHPGLTPNHNLRSAIRQWQGR